MYRLFAFGLMIFAITACTQDSYIERDPMEFTFDFSGGANGWAGDFADYPVGEAGSYELKFEVSTLPEPLPENEAALMLSGTNMSDDLFMFLKKKLTGLKADATYNITFTIEFASDVPDGQSGIGGSPGESVFIKAGATQLEPATVKDDMDYYRMNIDKGNQANDGEDMKVLGDFSNDTDQEVYTLKTVTNENPITATADSNGELWIIIGTDSGFEGNTTVYYNVIGVELK